MGTFFTILIAILVFGFLIFIHEFGHYISARIFKVTINEFAIGMGPKLVSYTSKKTNIQYSLRMFPIGGFVTMAGEDEESDDPNAFNKKSAWKRFIITAAGAAVNIIAGFLAMVLVVAFTPIGSTTVAEVVDQQQMEKWYPTDEFKTEYHETGLQKGDKILSVNGKDVSIYDELYYEIMRQGTEPVDLVIVRSGEKMTLKDVRFTVIEQQGQKFGMPGIKIYEIKKDFFGTIGMAFEKACLTMRQCWESVYDLITGRYSFAAVSGPVGISGAIGSAASDGFISLLNIVVLISINLGFMNLLPIPALDGGRLIVLLAEMVTRKKIPPKVEGIINAVGLTLLLGLSVVVMVKDIFQLF